MFGICRRIKKDFVAFRNNTDEERRIKVTLFNFKFTGGSSDNDNDDNNDNDNDDDNDDGSGNDANNDDNERLTMKSTPVCVETYFFLLWSSFRVGLEFVIFEQLKFTEIQNFVFLSTSERFSDESRNAATVSAWGKSVSRKHEDDGVGLSQLDVDDAAVVVVVAIVLVVLVIVIVVGVVIAVIDVY